MKEEEESEWLSVLWQIVPNKSDVNFLLYVMKKLNRKINMETILSKARKSLNLLKIIMKNPRGQDIKTHSSGNLSCKIETNIRARGPLLCSEELPVETTKCR